MKTLFLADLSVLTGARLNALNEQSEGTEVFVCQGQLGDLSVNTNFTQDQLDEILKHLSFKFVDIKKVKKEFLSFEKKFLVTGNDIFVAKALEELNLQGRKDVQVLSFEEKDNTEEMLEQVKLAVNISRQAMAAVSDLKLSFAALVEVLTDKQKEKYKKVLAEAKAKVDSTLSIQRDFLQFLASVQEKTTILDAVQKFVDEKELSELHPAIIQNYQRTSGLSPEEFDADLNELKDAKTLVQNTALNQAFLMAYTANKK